MLYPEGHPYHWPVIGYMPDLTAASHQDVVDFFKKYYAPSNASLVVAGDIDPRRRARSSRSGSATSNWRRTRADDRPRRRADDRDEEDDRRSRAAAAASTWRG
jgi:hypothetical protein